MWILKTTTQICQIRFWLETFYRFLNLKCFGGLYPWAIYDLQYSPSAISFNIIYIS